MDCTFEWVVEKKLGFSENFQFFCAKYGYSKCNALHAGAMVAVYGDVYRLASVDENVKLFIYL